MVTRHPAARSRSAVAARRRRPSPRGRRPPCARRRRARATREVNARPARTSSRSSVGVRAPSGPRRARRRRPRPAPSCWSDGREVDRPRRRRPRGARATPRRHEHDGTRAQRPVDQTTTPRRGRRGGRSPTAAAATAVSMRGAGAVAVVPVGADVERAPRRAGPAAPRPGAPSACRGGRSRPSGRRAGRHPARTRGPSTGPRRTRAGAACPRRRCALAPPSGQPGGQPPDRRVDDHLAGARQLHAPGDQAERVAQLHAQRADREAAALARRGAGCATVVRPPGASGGTRHGPAAAERQRDLVAQLERRGRQPSDVADRHLDDRLAVEVQPSRAHEPVRLERRRGRPHEHARRRRAAPTAATAASCSSAMPNARDGDVEQHGGTEQARYPRSVSTGGAPTRSGPGRRRHVDDHVRPGRGPRAAPRGAGSGGGGARAARAP